MIETSFVKLHSSRNLAIVYEQEIKDNQETLDKRKRSLEECLPLFDSAGKKFESAKSQKEQENKILVKVRELDTLIKETRQQCEEKDLELKRIKEKILGYQKFIDEAKLEQTKKTELLEKTLSYLDHHKSDSRLSEHLSGLEQQALPIQKDMRDH